MKKKTFLLLLVLLLIFSTVVTYVILGVIDTNKDDNLTEKENISTSPLSGEETTEEISKRRPVAVMFDNHPNARWQ